MSAELIHQMYIAYYQRPADPAGLIYWQDQLNANGGGEAGWNAVAAAFANAAESSMDPITKDSDVSSATVASQVSSQHYQLSITVNLTSGNDVVTPTGKCCRRN